MKTDHCLLGAFEHLEWSHFTAIISSKTKASGASSGNKKKWVLTCQISRGAIRVWQEMPTRRSLRQSSSQSIATFAFSHISSLFPKVAFDSATHDTSDNTQARPYRPKTNTSFDFTSSNCLYAQLKLQTAAQKYFRDDGFIMCCLDRQFLCLESRWRFCVWILPRCVISDTGLFAWKACPPSFSPESFITGGYFYQMRQTFTLITPSDGSLGLMAAIWKCWGARLKRRQ